MLPEKKCLRCGVSTNDARFDYILNPNGTPKGYRSRCYNCKNNIELPVLIPTTIINTCSVSVINTENLEPVIKKIEINDIEDNEHCYYTGILLTDCNDNEYQKKEITLNNGKKVNVCLAIELLKGSMSDSDFNKIINYLKVFSKSRKRRITPFDKQSDKCKEYLQKISNDNNFTSDELDNIRGIQGDCCYLSNIKMSWDQSKWNRGVLLKNKDNEYCLMIPLFAKLKKRMTEDVINNILQELIKHDKYS